MERIIRNKISCAGILIVKLYKLNLKLEELFSIQIVVKNLLTPIAPAQQMINNSLALNSDLVRHRQVFIANQEPVSEVRTDLLPF